MSTVVEEVAGGLRVESEPGRVVVVGPSFGRERKSSVFMWAERGEVKALIAALRRAEKNALRAQKKQSDGVTDGR